MHKVNRLKVNSSSLAWATRGTQLGWRRKILAEGAMNHPIYVAETLINSVNSQVPNLYNLDISGFSAGVSATCLKFPWLQTKLL